MRRRLPQLVKSRPPCGGQPRPTNTRDALAAPDAIASCAARDPIHSASATARCRPLEVPVSAPADCAQARQARAGDFPCRRPTGPAPLPPHRPSASTSACRRDPAVEPAAASYPPRRRTIGHNQVEVIPAELCQKSDRHETLTACPTLMFNFDDTCCSIHG